MRKVGEYLAMARQKEGVWYVGALTNWDARTMELDLSFLGKVNIRQKYLKMERMLIE